MGTVIDVRGMLSIPSSCSILGLPGGSLESGDKGWRCRRILVTLSWMCSTGMGCSASFLVILNCLELRLSSGDSSILIFGFLGDGAWCVEDI